jgi:hypothetical protein
MLFLLADIGEELEKRQLETQQLLKRKEELKKENAELKKQVEFLECLSTEESSDDSALDAPYTDSDNETVANGKNNRGKKRKCVKEIDSLKPRLSIVQRRDLIAWLKDTNCWYPSKDQKKHLCKKLDISLKQLTNWFYNVRRTQLKNKPRK